MEEMRTIIQKFVKIIMTHPKITDYITERLKDIKKEKKKVKILIKGKFKMYQTDRLLDNPVDMAFYFSRYIFGRFVIQFNFPRSIWSVL